MSYAVSAPLSTPQAARIDCITSVNSCSLGASSIFNFAILAIMLKRMWALLRSVLSSASLLDVIPSVPLSCLVKLAVLISLFHSSDPRSLKSNQDRYSVKAITKITCVLPSLCPTARHATRWRGPQPICANVWHRQSQENIDEQSRQKSRQH